MIYVRTRDILAGCCAGNIFLHLLKLLFIILQWHTSPRFQYNIKMTCRWCLWPLHVIPIISLIFFWRSSSLSASFLTAKSCLLAWANSEQLWLLEGSFFAAAADIPPTLLWRHELLWTARLGNGGALLVDEQVDPKIMQKWFNLRKASVCNIAHSLKSSKTVKKLHWMVIAKNPWKYVFCTGFCTEKYVLCTQKHVPGTGYTLGYVQNTYFVRVLCVFCMYFGVRVILQEIANDTLLKQQFINRQWSFWIKDTPYQWIRHTNTNERKPCEPQLAKAG